MTDRKKTTPTSGTLARPAIIAVTTAAVIGAGIAVFSPDTASKTAGYDQGGVAQNPTGAGSNIDGVVGLSQDGVTLQPDESGLISHSAASDLSAIESPETVPVADTDRALLSADEVIDPEGGMVDPETGLVSPIPENAAGAVDRQSASDDTSMPADGVTGSEG
ncbi:hypothetical protein [Cognatishimia sp. F0-27]|uniref:hypothetical protein n=1 Tax=Cognatishimia sp. F0-27 TaxID=2816855 RepID=UPI001D0CD582|nr:hypothetical protein [Cognatishimia sp. F0-27]MCC1492995.1 hypothetical protein [Cognatishimia sp. F0-27]